MPPQLTSAPNVSVPTAELLFHTARSPDAGAAPPIQLDRYKHPQVQDVLQILSMDGRQKLHSLSFYANRFGLKTDEPDIQGKDVGEAWRNGDFAAVERHCRLDVMTTARLAERIGVLKPELVA